MGSGLLSPNWVPPSIALHLNFLPHQILRIDVASLTGRDEVDLLGGAVVGELLVSMEGTSRVWCRHLHSIDRVPVGHSLRAARAGEGLGVVVAEMRCR